MGLSSIAHASDQITNYRPPYENKLYIGLAQTEVHFSLPQRCKGYHLYPLPNQRFRLTPTCDPATLKCALCQGKG